MSFLNRLPDFLSQHAQPKLTLADMEAALAEHDISLVITRKLVKHINFRVKPHSVYVSVPQRVSESVLVTAIQERLVWIRQAHQKLLSKQTRQHQNKHQPLTHGSTVMLWGEAFQLQLHHAQKAFFSINEQAKQVNLYMPLADEAGIRQLLVEVYREALRVRMAELFSKWQPVVGKQAKEMRLKKMTTRWGSCNVQNKRVWLSVYLAQHPIGCTEYVIVHELCHLHEANHSKRFWAHVSRAMPDYKHWHDYLKGTGQPVD